MHHPSLRRPAAAAAFALFALFRVATLAELWCPMHAGPVSAWDASDGATHHAAAHARAERAPGPHEAPAQCLCPGDCAGAVVAIAAPTARVHVAAVAVQRAPRPTAPVERAPAQDQLRLPFANGPPVA